MAASASTDVQEYVKVFVRIKPGTSANCIKCVPQEKAIQFLSRHKQAYYFDGIFDSAVTQRDVYNSAIEPIVKQVLEGYCCTVFTYGQAGTGKTYTMLGPSSCEESSIGIIPRSLHSIFDIVSQGNQESCVRMSCLDLYNEELIDLLLPDDNHDDHVKIYEDKKFKGVINFDNIVEETITDAEDLERILEQTVKGRSSDSVRSHRIFMFVINVCETTATGKTIIKSGKLTFVDLVGRNGKFTKEKNVNHALFTFRKVVTALTEKHGHVPYRESKLTRILQDSLQGQSKTILIATVFADVAHLDETINTLECASKVRMIWNFPKVNSIVMPPLSPSCFAKENYRLKRDIEASCLRSGVRLSEDAYVKLQSKLKSQSEKVMCKTMDIEEEKAKSDIINDKCAIIKNKLLEAKARRKELEEKNENHKQNISSYRKKITKKQQKLFVIERKQKELSTECNILLRNIQSLTETEDELFDKLASLYVNFQKNSAKVKDFKMVFSTLDSDLIPQVQTIINLAAETTDRVVRLDSELIATCFSLKTSFDRVNADFSKCKDKYVEIKASYQGKRIVSSSDLLDCVVTQFASVIEILTKIQTQYLNPLHESNRRCDDERKQYFEGLVDCLKNAYSLATVCANTVQDIITQTTACLCKQISEMETLTKRMFESTSELKAVTAEISNEFSDLKCLLDDLVQLKEYICIEFHRVTNEVTARSIKEELSLEPRSLSEEIRNLLGNIRFETSQHSELLCCEIDEMVVNLCDTIERGATLHQDLSNTLRHQTDELNQLKISDSQIQCNISLSDFELNCRKKEKIYDTELNMIDDFWNQLVHYSFSSVVTTQNLSKSTDDWTDTFMSVLNQTAVELKGTQSFLDKYESRLKSTVDKFCREDLTHVSHAGDTPQRPSKSSLKLSSVSLLNVFEDEPSPPKHSEDSLKLLKLCHKNLRKRCANGIVFNEEKENIDNANMEV